MPRTKTKTETPRKASSTDWKELIKGVPMHVFANMVTKSGLSPEDQRALTTSFKAYREG